MNLLQHYVAVNQERDRLIKLNHPRIQAHGNGISIDSWCDGNEQEQLQLEKLLSKFYRSFSVIWKHQHGVA